MSDVGYLEIVERRERKALAVRIKLGVSMLTTFGYSMLATALVDPIIKRSHLELANYFLVSLGAVFFFVALYLAPQGETP